MFDHVVFSVSNFDEARNFFVRALAPLGVEIISEGSLGIELCRHDNPASLCIRRVEQKTEHLHLAFTAQSRQQVQDFYRAALEAGGQDNGPPGVRPQYSGSYYAAFVIGPDGHNVEAVFHEPPV